jgi:hypothetical protein
LVWSVHEPSSESLKENQRVRTATFIVSLVGPLRSFIQRTELNLQICPTLALRHL